MGRHMKVRSLFSAKAHRRGIFKRLRGRKMGKTTRRVRASKTRVK